MIMRIKQKIDANTNKITSRTKGIETNDIENKNKDN